MNQDQFVDIPELEVTTFTTKKLSERSNFGNSDTKKIEEGIIG